MRNAMVADTKKHAEAMIAWLRFDPNQWEAMAYGQPVHQLYSNAMLIRPARGVEQEHTDWVLEKLVPNLCLRVQTLPPSWSIPQEHVA
ncbi:hypothetical protein [Bradyrhizobium sp. SZCCHNRI2010]|uniref:hypothetical protein n=1 Tax=Bradyrhizobium sp. SZCCHNRI2010 TaxID=3057283 RepID=UPI0028E5F2AE|nr:hypothetical protein [Bradyrhizobium sp. SZCCHNRI2010]